jgi:Xaa-Pro aminopeptidase
VTASIAADRYAERLERARAAIEEGGIDALLLGSGPDLRWLTGYDAKPSERLTMLVVPREGRATILVPRLEVAAARAATAVGQDLVDVAAWQETDDPIARLPGLGGLSETGRASLLVSDGLVAAFLLPIQRRLPDAELGLASTVLARLRRTKDADEIALLRRAAEAADRTVTAIAGGRLVGRTEQDVAREVAERLVEEGHDEPAFAIVASGPNSASPHHHVSERVIQAGESIVLDIGGRIQGYGSDITRTLWVTGGDPGNGVDDAFRALFEVLERAQSEARQAAVPGTSGEQVDRVARGIISDAGFGDAFIHRTGHGIGLEGHEGPYLVEGNDQPLLDGDAFSVEPGIYLDGRYGARIEDILVCRDGGSESLNRLSRSLMVVSGV